MVKIVSLIFIIVGCAAFGFTKASQIRERLFLLEEFSEMLIKLSTEISYFKEPLPQLFKRFSDEQNNRSSSILKYCYRQYEEENIPLLASWNEGIIMAYKGTLVTDDDIHIMEKVGQFIGQSNWERQEEHFKLVSIQLNRQIESARQMISTKGNMYKKMGISIGVVIAVIFI
ncbi:MAG: stage III sporulation protein AB [Anaerovoracaceae bacterium]